MLEPSDLSLRRWGETLRRERRLRLRRFRAGCGCLAAAAAAALFASLAWPPRPVLVWNASASSPMGLYRIMHPEGIRPGEMVVSWTPPEARALAASRGYLPANLPLVKQVAAAAGDCVCASGEKILLNGTLLAIRRHQDARGRPLPWWRGCRRLRSGELLLLMTAAPDSFDGRYFGVSGPELLVGRARLIWPS